MWLMVRIQKLLWVYRLRQQYLCIKNVRNTNRENFLIEYEFSCFTIVWCKNLSSLIFFVEDYILLCERKIVRKSTFSNNPKLDTKVCVLIEYLLFTFSEWHKFWQNNVLMIKKLYTAFYWKYYLSLATTAFHISHEYIIK